MPSSGPHLYVFTYSATKAAEQKLLETLFPSSQPVSLDLSPGVSSSTINNFPDPRHPSLLFESARNDTQRQLEFDENYIPSGPESMFIPNSTDAGGSAGVESSLSFGSNEGNNICEL